MCNDSIYPWGGFRCTLPEDHEGDHAAEGMLNRRTGKCAVLKTWRRAVPDPEPSPLVFHRTASGHHRVTNAGDEVYRIRRSGIQWIVTTAAGGVIVGAATNLDLAKQLARQAFNEREGTT